MLKLRIESFRIFTITQGSIGMFIICYIMYSHTRCDCCITGRSEFWNVWVQLVLGSQRRSIAHQFQGIEVIYWSLDIATSGSQFSSSNYSIPASVQLLNYSQRPLPSASIFRMDDDDVTNCQSELLPVMFQVMSLSKSS